MKATIKMHELIPGFRSRISRKALESRGITASNWLSMERNDKHEIIIDYLVERLASAEIELRKPDSSAGHLKTYSDH